MAPLVASSRPWLCVCVALVYFITALAADVRAAAIKINIAERDVDWPWKPQLAMPVPEHFFTGAAKNLTEADQWRVLSQVGAPLRVTSDSSLDLMQLLELVNFMRADGRGKCPCYTTPYRTFYYRFHADELELLYGAARWAALQGLQEPRAWSLVLRGDVGPTVRDAERFLMALKSVDPPGLLTVHVKGRPEGPSTMRVALADFRVQERVILAGHALEYRMPQLTVDGEAGGRRRHIHYFLLAKKTFNAHVAEFDAATVTAQNQLADSLKEAQLEEQHAYDTNARFKKRYQRFLMERQAHKAGEGDKTETLSADGKSRAAKQRRQAWQSKVRVVEAAPQARTAAERRAVACQKVYAAWNTLQRSGVRWETDGRAVQLRRLHTRHTCPEGLPNLRSNSQKHAPTLSGAARRSWQVAVAEMMAQREKSSRPPTLAQLFAALFAVWTAEGAEAIGQKVSGVAQDALHAEVRSGPAPDHAYHPTNFVHFVNAFVQSGDAVAAAGGWLPRFVRAELHYLLGILQLVPHNVSMSSSSASSSSPAASPAGSAGGVVRGVVHLHEALGAGSHHAAGALATLREHGIFTRQHMKAAMMLLLRSMKDAPSHMIRELVRTPHLTPDKPEATFTSPTGTSAQKASSARERDVSRLLRFEQFYAVDHTIREVDDPFMTRAGIRTMVAVTNENVHSTDEAPELEDVYREAEMERREGGYEGTITGRLMRRVLKGNLLLSGFKDTPRDAREAQCELLVVLRQLGYFCDLNMRYALSADRTRGTGATRLMTIVGLPLPDSCPEHEKEVARVLGNTQHTLLTCARGDVTATLPSLSHPRLNVPSSLTLHTMLHAVLVSLSYVHLLQTREYELSHMYAALSVEMSLRLQQLLVKRVARASRAQQHFDNGTEMSPVAVALTSVTPYEALATVAEGVDELAFAAELLMDDIEAAAVDDEAQTPREARLLDAQVLHAVGRCRSLADSPFVNTEALLLMALSRWAKGGPLVAGTLQASDVGRRLSQWTVEPFRLLAKLLGSHAASSPSPSKQRTALERETDALEVLKRTVQEAAMEATQHRSGATHTPEALDAHALFLVCLCAMKRWKADVSAVHLLDSTSYSVRRSDPFVLASFLLHARDAVTKAPLLSISAVRELAVAASPHLLGPTQHFLPLVDDTVEVYAARLLRFARRHGSQLEPSAELLRSGAYAVGAMMDETASLSAVGQRRHEVLDDAPPRRHRLWTLRGVKQQTLETADLQPLLYAADTHDYFNASRWTYMGTALNAAYNALLYPFTFTTAESVLVAMEARLQFIAPAEQKAVVRRYVPKGAEDAEKVPKSSTTSSSTSSFTEAGDDRVEAAEGTTSVSPFVDAFAKDVRLREHFIACLLLGFTLESGMPEGFSLLFYEATDRGNPFLRSLVDVFANGVFDRWTASVWTEHHLSAQSQREKGELPIVGSLFNLNTRSPFSYASLEARQELFARLSRWKAAGALAASAAAARASTSPQGGVSAARNQLLWCSGLLTRRAYLGSAQVYPFAYEGAIFPAADLECVAELNALLAAQGERTGTPVRWSKAQQRQAQVNGTDLLRDLGLRLAYDYDLVEKAPERRFPLSESEFRRNVSDLEIAVRLADRLNKPRQRFARVSTQLVEPWSRQSREISAETIGYGEGTYYSSRLHRVSGYRWGAVMQSWWLWLLSFFP